MHLHRALQSVALGDPLLRVSVGLRLALHLEAAADPAAAATVLKQVSCTRKLLARPHQTSLISFCEIHLSHLSVHHNKLYYGQAGDFCRLQCQCLQYLDSR